MKPIAAFFAFGALMAGLCVLALLFPVGPIEVIWSLKPAARRGLEALGTPASVALMGAVAAACGAAAAGLWRGRHWGVRLAQGILAVNLVGDVLNAILGGDPRAWIGVPIAALLLLYLGRLAARPGSKGQSGFRAAFGALALALIAVVVASRLQGARAQFDGRWTGTINANTDSSQKFEIDIARLHGRWIAEADVEDMGVMDQPLAVELTPGSNVLLTVRPGIYFRGRLERGALTGVFVRQDSQWPVILARTGDARISPDRIAFENSPANAARLTVLSPDGSELRRQFNRDRSKVRLLALLSPT